MKGVLSLIRWKSARSKGQPAALDIANRCKTALVLPPRAMTVVMPFSKAFGVMMSSGLMSRFNSSSNALQHRFKRLVRVQKISAAQVVKAGEEMGLPD